MQAFIWNIEELTIDNNYFRKVLFTWPHLQLVVMSLLPGEEIGVEIHDKEDQFIRIEQGTALAIIDGVQHDLSDDMVIVIPAGAAHNIINTSTNESLKLYTIYCEKHHEDGTIHKTKAEAYEAEDEHNH